MFSVQLGGELLPKSKELKFWVVVQSCRMDTVEVVWSSDQDSSWVPSLGGFRGTSDWEDTLGQTKNLLEEITYLTWDTPGGTLPGLLGKGVPGTLY